MIEEQDSSLSQLPEQASVDQEMKDGSESKEDATLPGLAVNIIFFCLQNPMICLDSGAVKFTGCVENCRIG